MDEDRRQLAGRIAIFAQDSLALFLYLLAHLVDCTSTKRYSPSIIRAARAQCHVIGLARGANQTRHRIDLVVSIARMK